MMMMMMIGCRRSARDDLIRGRRRGRDASSRADDDRGRRARGRGARRPRGRDGADAAADRHHGRVRALRSAGRDEAELGIRFTE
eukprot:31542-Pelagococcus_subviridis.AAC.1